MRKMYQSSRFNDKKMLFQNIKNNFFHISAVRVHNGRTCVYGRYAPAPVYCWHYINILKREARLVGVNERERLILSNVIF